MLLCHPEKLLRVFGFIVHKNLCGAASTASFYSVVSLAQFSNSGTNTLMLKLCSISSVSSTSLYLCSLKPDNLSPFFDESCLTIMTMRQIFHPGPIGYLTCKVAHVSHGLKVNPLQVMDLIHVAHFLGIQDLLDVTATMVARHLQGNLGCLCVVAASRFFNIWTRPRVPLFKPFNHHSNNAFVRIFFDEENLYVVLNCGL